MTKLPNGCYAVEIAPGVRIVCGNVPALARRSERQTS
jgi:hypothetical protein